MGQPVNVEVRPANAYNLNTEKTAGFMFPVLGALASMAVLVSASVGHMGRAALSLATVTLVVVGVRLVLTVRAGGHELGTFPFADRQRLGHDRGGRSRLRDRLHHALFAARARLRPRGPAGQPHHRHRPPRRQRRNGRGATPAGRWDHRNGLLRDPHAAPQWRLADHRLDCHRPPRRPLRARLRAQRRGCHRGPPRRRGPGRRP